MHLSTYVIEAGQNCHIIYDFTYMIFWKKQYEQKIIKSVVARPWECWVGSITKEHKKISWGWGNGSVYWLWWCLQDCMHLSKVTSYSCQERIQLGIKIPDSSAICLSISHFTSYSSSHPAIWFFPWFILSHTQFQEQRLYLCIIISSWICSTHQGKVNVCCGEWK